MARTDRLPDYVRSAGAAALGARLRRLSAAMDGDARRVYADFGVTFEQRWLGLLDLLSSHGPLTVGELAASLGISHPSVSQSRDSLAKARLIAWEADEEDKRRRRLRLTKEGEALVRRLRPLWEALDHAAVALDEEAGQVAAALDRLEDKLKARGLYERVEALIGEDRHRER
ncbi:MAG TPA: MarR family transcriptional regulator [Allosphingosinicella sp.]|nr:MarR family transcriptional regulator [Allosphingosinicella sp.]